MGTFRDIVCVFEGVSGIFEGSKGNEFGETGEGVEIFECFEEFFGSGANFFGLCDFVEGVACCRFAEEVVWDRHSQRSKFF